MKNIISYEKKPTNLFVFPSFYTADVLFLNTPVMWIRIDRMRIRIREIWWMQIQIQNNKITILISTHLLKVKKKRKKNQICTWILEISYFLRFRLEKYYFIRKKTHKFVCFPVILYVWIQIYMNAVPTENGSTSLKQTL